MKRKSILLLSASTLLFISCINAQVKKVKRNATPMPDSATMMKNWQMCMTPGDMQKMMASWDGKWDAEVSTWMKPGAPPEITKGTMVNKMAMGGRYQETVNTGTMMGQPFEGHGTLGYNNATKMFENSWIDNMGTGVMYMKGPWVAATKSCTLTGKMTDPGSMMEHDYKEIFKVINDNTQSLEMYGPGMDGKEMKMMEIKYTRKK
jgi:hypothetical protein